MTELGKVSKIVNAASDRSEAQGWAEKAAGGLDGCSQGTANEIRLAWDQWRKEDVRGRMKRLADKARNPADASFGPATKAKILALEGKCNQVWATVLGRVHAEVEQAPSKRRKLPPAIDSWVAARPEQQLFAPYCFVPEDDTRGDLLIQGPRYTAYYGSTWLVHAQVVSQQALPPPPAAGKPGFQPLSPIVDTKVPWGGALRIFAENLVSVMRAVRPEKHQAHEARVRRSSQPGFKSRIREQKAFRALAMSLLRRGLPTEVAILVYAFVYPPSTALIPPSFGTQADPTFHFIDLNEVMRI
ncbi:hypothetical protein DIPPA_31263 [Diplonema papillatum]|nr:hypothetical protein DIPPA_31263 [Diplonema papillatum]